LLTLTEEGLQQPNLMAFGGHHDCRAVEVSIQKLEKKINGLKLKLNSMTKKKDIEDLNKGIKTFESDIKKLKYWGVKVYDVGKYYIHLQ
jgi:Biofilm formation protein (YliH/bssR)